MMMVEGFSIGVVEYSYDERMYGNYEAENKHSHLFQLQTKSRENDVVGVTLA